MGNIYKALENSKPSRLDSLKVAGRAIKSFFTGDGILSDLIDPSGYSGGYTTQTFWQFLSGSHSFNRKGLQYLVENGYTNNPVGFGIITKISLAQSNIKFQPYLNGKLNKSKSFDLDMSKALIMLLTTGNVFIWKKEVVGFGTEYEVINTLYLNELKKGNGTYVYKYYLGTGKSVDIPYENLLHIKIWDLTCRDTNYGLSPLQAAIMPIEALREMYTADTSLLKNKGRDVLITNDSDIPLIEDEVGQNDKTLNERIGGALKTGGVATSNSKLRVLNLGRTVKELALWDGYKIKKRDLCDVLQVDSGLFNDPDNKTYSNRAEAEKSLYTSCVIPFCKVITENKAFKKIFGEIYLDTSNIECLQISQNLRFEKNNTISDAVIKFNLNVNSGTITKEIAVNLLVTEWGYDEEEAVKMIVDKETNLNPTTDKVNTLSPIVATKVLESMTTNERRDLVGLEDMADGDSIPQPAPSF